MNRATNEQPDVQPDVQPDSPSAPRPWYRLHWITLLGAMVLVVLLVLVNLPASDSMSAFNIFYAGWPAIYQRHEVSPLFGAMLDPVRGTVTATHDQYWPGAGAIDGVFALVALAGWCLLAEMIARRRFSIRQLLAATCCIAALLGIWSSTRSHNRTVQALPSEFLFPSELPDPVKLQRR